MPKIFPAFAILIFSLIISPTKTLAATTPKFRRPVNNTPPISAHYDNKSGTGIADYSCGTNTYNGHTGTDFATPKGTAVFAGAYGNIYYTYDNCPTYGSYGSLCGGGYGNHVRIDHEPDYNNGQGWVTIYAHMQKGTPIRPRYVNCGELIGLVGSSGNSTGPHLHFEVRKYNTPYNDPYAGSCSGPQQFWSEMINGYPTTKCTS